MTSDFSWPAQYSFPPFFTIQPNVETKTKQLNIWSQLVLNYCEAKHVFILNKSNSLPLFNNKEISRQLSVEALDTILEHMRSQELIEWLDAKKDRCFVYWHSPTEWGTRIYSYAQSNGLINSVETFFSLINSGMEFNGMDVQMLKKCLLTLQSRGKVEVMGDDGVKFF